MALRIPLPAHGGQLRQIAEHFGVPADELLDFSANINPVGPTASVHHSNAASARRSGDSYRRIRISNWLTLGGPSLPLHWALPRKHRSGKWFCPAAGCRTAVSQDQAMPSAGAFIQRVS